MLSFVLLTTFLGGAYGLSAQGTGSLQDPPSQAAQAVGEPPWWRSTTAVISYGGAFLLLFVVFAVDRMWRKHLYKELLELAQQHEAELEAEALHAQGQAQEAMALHHQAEAERDAMQQRLARQQQRLDSSGPFRTMIDHTSDLFLILDEDASLAYANATLERMLGYASDASLGQSIEPWLAEEDRPLFRKRFDEALAAPHPPEPFQLRVRSRPGDPMVLDVHLTNLLDDPSVGGVVLQGMDATDRSKTEQFSENYHQRLEQEMSRKTQELRQRDQNLREAVQTLQQTRARLVEAAQLALLGRLTGSLATDFQRELHFSSTHVQPARRDLETLQSLMQHYDDVFDSQRVDSNRLFELQSFRKKFNSRQLFKDLEGHIRDIEVGLDEAYRLAASLRTFAETDGNLTRTNLHDGLDAALLLLDNRIKHRIHVRRVYGELPAIECHPGRLNQAFLHLLAYAVQSTEKDGTLFLTTTTADRHVTVSIRFSGRGLSEEEQAHLFEPLSEAQSNNGLGLSVSHQTIEKHHGTLKVTGNPGQDAEFIVTLPVEQSAPPNGA